MSPLESANLVVKEEPCAISRFEEGNTLEDATSMYRRLEVVLFAVEGFDECKVVFFGDLIGGTVIV